MSIAASKFTRRKKKEKQKERQRRYREREKDEREKMRRERKSKNYFRFFSSDSVLNFLLKWAWIKSKNENLKEG